MLVGNTDVGDSRDYAGSMLSMGLGGTRLRGHQKNALLTEKHVQKLNSPVILLTTVDTDSKPYSPSFTSKLPVSICLL